MIGIETRGLTISSEIGIITDKTIRNVYYIIELIKSTSVGKY